MIHVCLINKTNIINKKEKLPSGILQGATVEGVPKGVTYDEIQIKTYMEVKGSGTANQCPTIDGGTKTFGVKPGKDNAKKFWLEPTSFTVKAETVGKYAPPEIEMETSHRSSIHMRRTYC